MMSSLSRHSFSKMLPNCLQRSNKHSRLTTDQRYNISLVASEGIQKVQQMQLDRHTSSNRKAGLYIFWKAIILKEITKREGFVMP